MMRIDFEHDLLVACGDNNGPVSRVSSCDF
jgi:hypothetical protein